MAHPTQPTKPPTTTDHAARVLAAARRYDRELAALADRMEAEGARLRNRGAWNRAVWLLRQDAREQLALFVGEWMLRAAEAAEVEVDADADDAEADDESNETPDGEE